MSTSNSSKNQAQRNIVNFVHSPPLSASADIRPNGTPAGCSCVDHFIGEAATTLALLGMVYRITCVPSSIPWEDDTSDVSSNGDSAPTNTEVLADSLASPMARMVEQCTCPVAPASTQAASEDLTYNCEVVLLGTDLSRHQQTEICCQASKSQSKGANTKSVLLIDDSTLEHSGPGSWPDVFRAADTVVISARAALMLTAADSLELAAKSLQYMCRGIVIIVHRRRLIYCVCNQVRELELVTERRQSIEHMLARSGAAAAVAAIQGCDAEQTVLAASAAMNLKTPMSLLELVQRGKENSYSHEVRRARRNQLWQSARLVGTATASALLLMAVLLPWL